MTPLHVVGLGVWTPSHPTLDAWKARDASAAGAPSSDWIARRQLRRSTMLARMSAHALAEALGAAGRSRDQVALLTASVGGELSSTFANLELLHETPAASSPLRFGNSVHNAALGHLAIPARNQQTASAIAASRGTLTAMGLLEAMAHTAQLGVDAALVFCEETWPRADFEALAVAVVLSADATGSLGTLDDLSATAGDLPVSTLPEALAPSPAAGALHLLDALLAGSAGRIALSDAPWSVRWTPA
jgi:hypothetical protein